MYIVSYLCRIIILCMRTRGAAIVRLSMSMRQIGHSRTARLCAHARHMYDEAVARRLRAHHVPRRGVLACRHHLGHPPRARDAMCSSRESALRSSSPAFSSAPSSPCRRAVPPRAPPRRRRALSPPQGVARAPRRGGRLRAPPPRPPAATPPPSPASHLGRPARQNAAVVAAAAYSVTRTLSPRTLSPGAPPPRRRDGAAAAVAAAVAAKWLPRGSRSIGALLCPANMRRRGAYHRRGSTHTQTPHRCDSQQARCRHLIAPSLARSVGVTRIVLSAADVDARRVPSGLHSQQYTSSLWPSSTRRLPRHLGDTLLLVDAPHTDCSVILLRRGEAASAVGAPRAGGGHRSAVALQHADLTQRPPHARRSFVGPCLPLSVSLAQFYLRK